MPAVPRFRRRQSCWQRLRKERECGPCEWLVVSFADEGLKTKQLTPTIRAAIRATPWLGGFHRNPKLLQLSLADRGGRIYHKVDCACGFGEWYDLAQVIGSRQYHNNPVQPQRDASMWRRAVFQRFEKESEPRACFRIAHTQSLENFPLDILAMNTDRARTQLGAIQHHVIG